LGVCAVGDDLVDVRTAVSESAGCGVVMGEVVDLEGENFGVFRVVGQWRLEGGRPSVW